MIVEILLNDWRNVSTRQVNLSEDLANQVGQDLWMRKGCGCMHQGGIKDNFK
jgi:hypothetical protein